MMNINDDFIIEMADSLDFEKNIFKKALRNLLELNKKNDNRFIMHIKTYDKKEIENDMLYIKDTLGKSILKYKYIIIVLKLYNNSEKIDFKSIYNEYADDNIILLDVSKIIFDKENALNYCFYLYNYEENLNSDSDKSNIFKEKADSLINEWFNNVKNNEVMYYDKNNKCGLEFKKYEDFKNFIFDINKKQYPEYPEELDVNPILYDKFELEKYKDIELVVTDEIKLYIAKLKKYIEKYFSETLKKNNAVDGVEFIKYLNKEPYGFLPSKLAVYLLISILKEYINNGYYYVDKDTSDYLNDFYIEYFVINSFNKAFKNMPSLSVPYICKRDENIKKFIEITSNIFTLNEDILTIQDLKEALRIKISSFKYPLWLLDYIDIDDDIKKIIYLYLDIINPNFNDEDIYDNNENKNIDIILDIYKKNNAMFNSIKYIINDDNLDKGMYVFLGDKKKLFDEIINKSILSNNWKWIYKNNRIKEMVEGMI